jgi:hydrogenase-4 component E
MRKLEAPTRSDIIPANLLSWALAGAAVMLAFRFAGVVEPGGGDRALHVAVSAAAVLLGLLVLGTQSTLFSQIIGVLRVEYAIALFELGSEHAGPLPVQLGLVGVLVLSVVLLGIFLRGLGPTAGRESAATTPGVAR